MEKIHKFTLDISKGITNTDIEIVTQDYASHKLEINLVEDGYKTLDLTDTIVRLIVRKADGTTVQQDCSIIGDGQISVLLQLNTINVAGICKAEIQVYDSNVANKRLTSTLFNFRVRQSLQNDETVESKDEFSMLQNALEQAQDIDNKILNKTGILTEIEPSLQATLSDQGKDLNLVNVANAIYKETTKPDWTSALTQMKSIFIVGTGTNPDGVEVDYSSSVKNGQISNLVIKGNTEVVNGVIKSTISTRLKSAGKNLFDKINGWEYGVIDGGSFELTSSGNPPFKRTKPIKCEPNQLYVISGGNRNIWRFEDSKGNLISGINASSVTTPSNTHQMRVYYSSDGTHNDTLQIEKGNVVTSYEPYTESVSYINLPDGEELRSLPNGVKDEIKDGVLCKRVSDKLIYDNVTGWIRNSYDTTRDMTRFAIPITNSLSDVTTSINVGAIKVVTDLNVALGENVNSVDSYVITGGHFWLILSGEISISEFETVLNSNPISLIYQLAEPKTYPLNITPLQCFKGGTISIEPYLAKKYTITGTSITLDYPIISIDSIKKLVNNEEQIVTGATLSADGLIISNINAGTYIVEGAIKPEYSTIPSTVMSYPKNTSAQTDGNTEMISIHSKLLKELILASL